MGKHPWSQNDLGGYKLASVLIIRSSTKIVYIPESFPNFSHQLLTTIIVNITFLNSQLEKTNLKGDFVVKNWFETIAFNFWYKKNRSESKIYNLSFYIQWFWYIIYIIFSETIQSGNWLLL